MLSFLTTLSLPQLSPTETTLSLGPENPSHDVPGLGTGVDNIPSWKPGRMLTSLRPGGASFWTLEASLPGCPLELSACPQHSTVPAQTLEESK